MFLLLSSQGDADGGLAGLIGLLIMFAVFAFCILFFGRRVNESEMPYTPDQSMLPLAELEEGDWVVIDGVSMKRTLPGDSKGIKVIYVHYDCTRDVIYVRTYRSHGQPMTDQVRCCDGTIMYHNWNDE